MELEADQTLSYHSTAKAGEIRDKLNEELLRTQDDRAQEQSEQYADESCEVRPGVGILVSGVVVDDEGCEGDPNRDSPGDEFGVPDGRHQPVNTRGMGTYRPRARMTSVYVLAAGTILPMVWCHIVGTIIHAAVEAQKPPHSTESQIDHQSYITPDQLDDTDEKADRPA